MFWSCNYVDRYNKTSFSISFITIFLVHYIPTCFNLKYSSYFENVCMSVCILTAWIWWAREWESLLKDFTFFVRSILQAICFSLYLLHYAYIILFLYLNMFVYMRVLMEINWIELNCNPLQIPSRLQRPHCVEDDDIIIPIRTKYGSNEMATCYGMLSEY